MPLNDLQNRLLALLGTIAAERMRSIADDDPMKSTFDELKTLIKAEAVKTVECVKAQLAPFMPTISVSDDKAVYTISFTCRDVASQIEYRLDDFVGPAIRQLMIPKPAAVASAATLIDKGPQSPQSEEDEVAAMADLTRRGGLRTLWGNNGRNTG